MKDNTEISKISTGNKEQLKQAVGFVFHLFVVAFKKINLHNTPVMQVTE